MLPRVEHRYVAEVHPEGGAAITTSPLDLDWTPAIEWAHWQRVRSSAAALASAPGPARIRPRWDAKAGVPYVAELEVAFDDGEPAPVEAIPLRYVAGAVQHEVSGMVATGRIEEGAPLTWRICAYPAPPPEPGRLTGDAFRVEEPMPSSAPLASCSLPGLLRQARRHGPERTAEEPLDTPVFFAPKVLDEAAAAACAAGELEAGGVLLGRVVRDSASGELVVEVLAQVPAREAIADDASLRFTPATWQAVHAAIDLRRAGEQIVGWYHSHPVKLWPCRDCPPERRAGCPSNRAFFSAMDVAFHRTVFQGAHNLALLLSFHRDPMPRFDVFGWRQGLIAVRGYYIVEESA